MNIALQTESNTGLVPLFSDKIFAITGLVPLDGPFSYQPATAQGWMPFNLYAVRDGGDLLLIDTGVSVHEPLIRKALDVLTPGTSRRRVLLTRREPDTTVNLPWIIADYGFSAVHTPGDLNPLDFFAQMEDAAAAAQINAMTHAEFVPMPGDGSLDAGAITVQMQRTSVRVLTTSWCYEATSKTLFTSDSWGHVMCPSEDAPTVVAPTEHDMSPEAMIAFISRKFDWLIGIDNAPMIADVRALLDGPPIDRLCPTYGCVIEGRENVRRVLEATCIALEQLAQQPFPNVLGDITSRFGKI